VVGTTLEWAGPEVASGSSVWANFLTHFHDAQMVLERWPCKEPFPGAKGWSVNDISSHGINLMFRYLMSKDELKDLAPHIVGWSDSKFHLHHKTSSDRMALEYKTLEAGSEAWLEIPIVTGATESGKVLVLAHVKQCLAEVHNAARQKDGGPDVAPPSSESSESGDRGEHIESYQEEYDENHTIGCSKAQVT
jgi:hypothetical protein